jgi:TonB family protein
MRSLRSQLRVRAASGPVCFCSNPEDGSQLLSSEQIRRVVVRNLGQVRHCYQQALETNAGASGRLSVRWVIGADGQVMGAGVESNDTGVASLGDCVTSAVRRWQFPPPSAGVVTVTYPFTLDVAE